MFPFDDVIVCQVDDTWLNDDPNSPTDMLVNGYQYVMVRFIATTTLYRVIMSETQTQKYFKEIHLVS